MTGKVRTVFTIGLKSRKQFSLPTPHLMMRCTRVGSKFGHENNDRGRYLTGMFCSQNCSKYLMNPSPSEQRVDIGHGLNLIFTDEHVEGRTLDLGTQDPKHPTYLALGDTVCQSQIHLGEQEKAQHWGQFPRAWVNGGSQWQESMTCIPKPCKKKYINLKHVSLEGNWQE